MRRLLILVLCLIPLSVMGQTVGTCQMVAPTQMDFADPTFGSLDQIAYSQIEVECEAGMPYQLEVQNAGVGGQVLLHAANGAQDLPISLVQSVNRQAWGAINQGEAIGGVGTGGTTTHQVEAHLNLSRLPKAGVYQATVNLMLVF